MDNSSHPKQIDLPTNDKKSSDNKDLQGQLQVQEQNSFTEAQVNEWIQQTFAAKIGAMA